MIVALCRLSSCHWSYKKSYLKQMMVYFCSISKFAASSRAMMISKLDQNIAHLWPVLWIRIRMDPHQIERKVISRIRFRISLPKYIEFEPIWALFWRFWAFIWKLGSGSALSVKVSIKRTSRIRIRIKVTRRIRVRIKVIYYLSRKHWFSYSCL